MGYSTKAISFFVKLEQTECQQIYTRLMSITFQSQIGTIKLQSLKQTVFKLISHRAPEQWSSTVDPL